MADEIRIRDAVPADARALATLVASVQQIHAAARPDLFKPVLPSDLEAWAAEAVVTAHLRVVLAAVGDTSVGYAVVIDQHRPDNPFGFERRWREVEQIGVDPRHRRRGVARALLDHIAASARADGMAVELDTWSFNAAARAAFERLGFAAKTVRFERREE
jgi:ribosomal protein S18 acetylase RimI-like enzyme